MKILTLGNSFSCDATRYLHQLAASAGKSINVYNLSIGGCSLRTHYLNMLEDAPNYSFLFNGEGTELKTSIRQVLKSAEWDCITLQQASHFSAHYDTYQPYLNELAAYMRKYSPNAKILIHETWAYEDGSERLAKVAKFDTAAEMLENIRASYNRAAEDIGAAGIIPSGDAMYRALENGIGKIHRDSFHASLGAGRYLLALLWYGYLTGKSVADVPFADFDEPVSDEEIATVKKTAAEILAR